MGRTYILYNSSTTQATPGQPDGSSILCLACHDGTIALGQILSGGKARGFGGPSLMPPHADLTTDLSDDHPISFEYTSALAMLDGQLKDPSEISQHVTLENGKVQCTTCHDPHDNTYTKFLVASRQNSDLCLSCHEPSDWAASVHNTSSATWSGTGVDPWGHIEEPFPTVAENACENCHDPHNAEGKIRLLKGAAEEDNCIDCHNGNTASTDIASQLNKMYKHDVMLYNQVHDPNEPVLQTTRHVECQDCHNPHAANATEASAPLSSGALYQVPGIDINGSAITTITNEYELCLRCHANDGAAVPVTKRTFAQYTIREEFNNSRTSFHPVAYVGKNTTDVPSLIAPYSVSSQIYCSDCHGSDGANAPAGPHGSSYPQILSAYYNRSEFPGGGGAYIDPATEYALCAKCHDVRNLSSSHSANEGHILQYTSCNTCHDPHASDQPYLLNYNPNVISPNTNGNTYIDTTIDNCNLTCHPPGSNKTIVHNESY